MQSYRLKISHRSKTFKRDSVVR